MSTAEDAPIEVRRADFFATFCVLMGATYLGVQGFSFLDDGSFDLLLAALGFVWFGAAGYYHLRPDSMSMGSEPAPRTWFEIAGILITLAVLAIVIGGLLAI